jgi:hypothetical protein
MRSGLGTLILPDGRKYEGSFENGTFSGQGTLSWPNGTKYVGAFANGQFNGRGTYFYNGGTTTGEWKDNTFLHP